MKKCRYKYGLHSIDQVAHACIDVVRLETIMLWHGTEQLGQVWVRHKLSYIVLPPENLGCSMYSSSLVHLYFMSVRQGLCTETLA